MKKFFDRFKSDPEGDFDNGGELNDRNHRRNVQAAAGLIIILLVVGGAAAMVLQARNAPADEGAEATTPIDFGAVVDPEFTAKDNQSALSAQQVTITTLEKMVADLTKTVKAQSESNALFRKRLKQDQEAMSASLAQQGVAIEETLAEKLQAATVEKPSESKAEPVTKGGRYFGETFGPASQPQSYSALENDGSYPTHRLSPTPGQKSGIDHIAFTWADDTTEQRKRTPENYVPSGTVITAMVTGGADANAGVNGQGDTTPVVLQTMDNGLLPNGKPSRLKDCTFTAAAYGEVSTSRGIVRTNRMSCILDDEMIDIPVEATVFNFGRNGIRGNTVIRNGDIVQMAGVASLLKGTGDAASNLSQTTSTSALGTTSSVKPEDALLNILGEAGKGAGQTLADYYIQLAEQYHPFIEMNPGNVVNIVILKGFPLDAVGIAEYEAELAQQQSGIPSPAAQIIETITNPLMNQLPAGARPVPGQAAPQTASPFGLPQ